MMQALTRYCLLSAAAMFLAACAAPASHVAPTPSVATETHHPHSVQVKAGSLVSIGIANNEMKAAIEAAILQGKLFKAIVQNADYELSVTVTGVSTSSVGGAPNAQMEAIWLLTEMSSGKVALRRSIRSTGAAPTKEAAVQRAAGNNISNGLDIIAELKL